MSDYVKATNFTAKDSLPTGNSGKIVKGAELDTEYTAVANAIASKANINSPTFTGTPAGPTANIGSNTTQLANTAFVKAAVDALGTIGTMAAQAASSVAITGGSITGITDLAVADGGTGASTLTGVVIGNGTSAMTAVAPGTSGNVLTSNGTTWTSTAPTAVKGLGLGGEVWNNVTGSRSRDQTYTNSRSYPIMVSVSLVNSNGVYFYINGNLICRSWADVNTGAGQVGYDNVCIIVPAGATYSAAAGNVYTWYELY